MSRIITPDKALWLPERLRLRGGRSRSELCLPKRLKSRHQRSFLINPYVFGGGGGVVYKSHLLFPGADGSTTFTDDTGLRTWTAFGNAQIDTSLGDQRGLFDGSGDYITTPNSADIVFGPGPWTLRFTLRYNSLAGFQTITSKGYTINESNHWLLQTGNGDGRINVYRGGGGLIVNDGTTTMSTGVDYLIELITDSSNNVTLKVNGATVDTGNWSADLNGTGELSIGGGSSSGYNNFWFNGWIKDYQLI